MYARILFSGTLYIRGSFLFVIFLLHGLTFVANDVISLGLIYGCIAMVNFYKSYRVRTLLTCGRYALRILAEPSACTS